MATQRRERRTGAAITFLGAAGTVTGSKYLLDTPHARLLVDCGIFQGVRELRERNWADPPFDPASVDAVLLTHAHNDHIGFLPRVVKRGFSGPIYCSAATAKLAEILLADSAHLQQEEADFRNRNSRTRHNPALPLFDEDDVRRTLRLFRPLRPGHEHEQVADGVFAEWSPTGHILGARSIRVTIDGAGTHGEQRTILFSGDVGRKNQPILPDPAPPEPADYVLTESTYGDRKHSASDPIEGLAQVVRDAQASNSTVLIPAFAVGRTQDILYHLRELEDQGRIPIVRVRADSPMAAKATEVYLKALAEHDDETRLLFDNDRNPLRTHSMLFTSSQAESRALNDERGARVIVSASGMMTGGRVLHHALRVLPDPNATLCFVGYQAEGTTGRRIQDGETDVQIFKEWVPVRCKIVTIGGFSAHADADEILDWLAPLAADAPRQVFVVHGEPPAAEALRERLIERYRWNVSVPAHGERFELA